MIRQTFKYKNNKHRRWITHFEIVWAKYSPSSRYDKSVQGPEMKRISWNYHTSTDKVDLKQKKISLWMIKRDDEVIEERGEKWEKRWIDN